MSYLSIISLEDAKLYLRVDDTLTEDDKHIERLISGAFSYIERVTNLMLYSRLKSYLVQGGCVAVYDYPINQLVEPTTAERTQKNGFSNYSTTQDTEELKLNVGYLKTSDIPHDLIEVAYEIIDLTYYQHETGKTVVKDLSDYSREVLNSYKRFVI